MDISENKNSNLSYMGRIHGNWRRYPSDIGNEGGAYVCVYEFEEVSKDQGKMALGCKAQSRFVYNLKPAS